MFLLSATMSNHQNLTRILTLSLAALSEGQALWRNWSLTWKAMKCEMLACEAARAQCRGNTSARLSLLPLIMTKSNLNQVVEGSLAIDKVKERPTSSRNTKHKDWIQAQLQSKKEANWICLLMSTARKMTVALRGSTNFRRSLTSLLEGKLTIIKNRLHLSKQYKSTYHNGLWLELGLKLRLNSLLTTKSLQLTCIRGISNACGLTVFNNTSHRIDKGFSTTSGN